MLPPDLDPALPHAHRAVAHAEVVRAFERSWPGPGRAPAVRECALDYMRWWPGEQLVATFTLTLESAAASPGAGVITVVVRPDGASYTPLPRDSGLPGLAQAADPAAMRTWFGGAVGLDVRDCSITPARYRPGRRCVLRYDINWNDGTATTFYGKVLPRDESETLAAVLHTLGDIPAPVIAVAPQWGLIVQADTGGSSLSRAGKGAVSAGEIESVVAAAELLARLHGTAARGPMNTLHGDAVALLDFVPACERFAPAPAALLREAADVLSSCADVELAPAHGAFRLDQVHITPGGAVLIDLDSFCVADRERDLGNLFAYLQWRAIRHPDARSALSSIRAAFLTAYERASRRSLDPERLRRYQAVSLLKIAGRRYVRLKSGEWPLVPQLVDAAAVLLRQTAAAS